MAPTLRTTGELVTASIWNTDVVDEISSLYPGIATITTTGTQTGLPLPSGHGSLVLIANNASLLTIQGIDAGADGQRLTILSKGAGQVDLANQHASANAFNRIICGVTGTISLAAGSGRVSLVYDATTQRWRVSEHEQGAWITPTYASANFSGNVTGAGDWSVAAGDVTAYAYHLRGRTVTLAWWLVTTTVANSPTALRLAVPGGFSIARNAGAGVWVRDNGTYTAGIAMAGTAFPNQIEIHRADNAGFANCSDLTDTYGEIVFEVS